MSRNQITIAICGSMLFAKEMLGVASLLEKQGYQCILPINTQEWASGAKKYINESEGARRKREGNLLRIYFDIIKDKADVLLVVNEEKQGVENYIGGNTFAEMFSAHCLQKPIFILNSIPEENDTTRIIWQEIKGISDFPDTICLQGDLSQLTPKLKQLRPELFPATDKVCDHTSVGALIWRNINQKRELLLIERKKYPFGFAPPAGHVDKRGGVDPWAATLKEEVEEETGLKVWGFSRIIHRQKASNPCRRIDGTWHAWNVYEDIQFSGTLKPSPDETKQAGWYSMEQIQALAEKTMDYLTGKITEGQWRQNPGLEPVWLKWFLQLGYIRAAELIDELIEKHFTQ